MFKVGDIVKLNLDKVADEYKKFDKEYKIVEIKEFGDDKFYKLDKIDALATNKTLIKVEK